MKSYLAQFLFLVIAGTMALGASGAEFADSVNLGIGGLNPMAHCNAKVFIIEYEHQLTPVTAFVGRGSGVNYRYNDGHYLEDGRLRGVDFGARYYPAGGMQGFFVGGGLGYWSEGRTFIQYQNTPSQYQGKASSYAPRLNVDVGDRIPIRGTSVSIMPEVNLGKFFSPSSCEITAPASQVGMPCSRKSEVNYYVFAGVAVGVAF